MGCIASKQAGSALSPASESYRRPLPGGRTRAAQFHGSCISRSSSKSTFSGLLTKSQNSYRLQDDDDDDGDDQQDINRRALRLAPRYVEAEHVAAGWPSWLSAAAGEAIHGWVPLKADAYEKLEKIGQGTYSSVFRAREVQTGRIFALKKVNFDNFQPESVRFMAREISILRRLDHPNIVKLEGLITSRLSCSIYLVFEYMEHDLAGLLSSPEVNFTEAQIKCYMKQLMAGVEHCHAKGVMHRDIKASNILVNNEGVLKIGDFGLANVLSSKNRHSLTSRVVTLWYRPPELLMGSTDYGVYVDLWSVGCVFGELLSGKAILKGRTEVEQLHKIFKLCGSPPEEYWKQSKLPLATMFKPQHTYESSLRDRFKDFPLTALNLVETLLSIEPYKRGTASSALSSKYFTTEPFACEPSSLPKYAPNKEIDAKIRHQARRKRAGRTQSATTRKPRKTSKAMEDPNGVPKQRHVVHEHTRSARRLNGASLKLPNGRGEVASKMDNHFSGPVSFSWAQRQTEDFTSSLSFTMSSTVSKSSLGISEKENAVSSGETTNAVKHEKQSDLDDLRYVNSMKRAEFSGPLWPKPEKMDELLERNERHIRQGIRKPSF